MEDEIFPVLNCKLWLGLPSSSSETLWLILATVITPSGGLVTSHIPRGKPAERLQGTWSALETTSIAHRLDGKSYRYKRAFRSFF